MALSSRDVLARTALILLLVLPVAFVSYYVGRHGAVQNRIEYREPQLGGEAVPSGIAARLVPGAPIYVPAYSHIYVEGGKGTLLTITLSVRNTSASRKLVLDSVEYYDTRGDRVREYLGAPLQLGPLETGEFLVAEEDTSGGSGANFLVHYRGESGSTPPLVEAIMVGRTGSGMFSFSRVGTALVAADVKAESPAKSTQ